MVRGLAGKPDRSRLRRGVSVSSVLLETVRTGFQKAWPERGYPTILAVAGKIPESVLEEDGKLMI